MKRSLILSLLIFALVLLLIFTIAMPVHAQGTTPYIFHSTKPISAELRSYLDAWLAASAPANVPYYAATNVSLDGSDTVVSLVALNLSSPDEKWNMEDGTKAVWLGSVRVHADGTVDQGSVSFNRGSKVQAMPGLSAGGGSYIAFPFASGTTAQYGPRGVHDAGYGTSGMKAVDLVGGDAMGSSVMPPAVYASDAGVIDYVCDDGTSVAVRTYNSSTGDYFIYAHMLNNASLAENTSFTRGQLIGSLKYGTFDDDCGWTTQADNQYHVHWAFVPSGGTYQVGSCVLTISNKVWSCGGVDIKIGGFLAGGGGYNGSGETSGASGAGETVTDPTFFDYILAGFLQMVDTGIVRQLPNHQAFEYTYVLWNVVNMFFRLVWVLAASNLNLVPLMSVLFLGITIKLLFGVAEFIAFLFKAWKSLVPIVGA